MNLATSIMTLCAATIICGAIVLYGLLDNRRRNGRWALPPVPFAPLAFIAGGVNGVANCSGSGWSIVAVHVGLLLAGAVMITVASLAMESWFCRDRSRIRPTAAASGTSLSMTSRTRRACGRFIYMVVVVVGIFGMCLLLWSIGSGVAALIRGAAIYAL